MQQKLCALPFQRGVGIFFLVNCLVMFNEILYFIVTINNIKNYHVFSFLSRNVTEFTLLGFFVKTLTLHYRCVIFSANVSFLFMG